MEEIDDFAYTLIQAHSKKGNQHFDNKNYDAAIEEFRIALKHVPEPKTDWEAGLWLYTSIGDAFFSKGEFTQAKESLHDAFNCAGGTDNPFVSLRLGQAYFELNVIDKAEEYLMRAYMLDGKKIFRGEPKKYVNHLKKTFDI